MNIRPVFHLISYLILITGFSILGCAAISFFMRDPIGMEIRLLLSGITTWFIGGVLWFFTRGDVELSRRDGFGIVFFGWLFLGLVGALPYVFTGTIPHYVDAVFETLSGYTTTGATVVTDVEALPKGILFWRSLTQWFGGMGVILLCVAILPFLGVGGMQLYRAEVPGPSKDRLTPRIASTAKLLWGVYLILTILQTIMLKLGGMPWFDAINHSFCTLSTGGFSTKNTSAMHYLDSDYIQLVFILFMFLGGINFSLHFRALTGRPLHYFSNPECRVYMGYCLLAGFILSLQVYGDQYQTLSDAIIAGYFQALSIITTTGFANADFDTWSNASKTLLFVMMFTGGCAGSTTGGLKLVRLHVCVKDILRQVRLFMQPNAVLKVKLGRQSVDQEVVDAIVAMLAAFVLIFALGTLCMSYFVDDWVAAASATIATLGNVGPGFGSVGATQNFADIPMAGKALLSFFMVLGRLELFTVLVVLTPGFWRK